MWHKHLNSTEENHRHTLLFILLGGCLGLWILWVVTQPVFSPEPDPVVPDTVVALPLPDPDAIDLDSASDLLIEAIVQIESGGDPNRVGSIGERGLMQIRESTWNQVTQRHFDTPPPFCRAFEPDLNREVGRLYLGDLQAFLYDHREHWRSDLRSLLLACYNAGPERVRFSGFNLRQLPKSVQSYARRGSALHDAYLQDDVHTLHNLLIEAAEKSE